MNPFGETGAVDDMEKRGNLVWLYAGNIGLVGFGALSLTEWRLPDPKRSPKVLHPHILFIGVDKRLRGHPVEARFEQRYSALIMSDLLSEAKVRFPESMNISLMVHEQSPARKFHERFGFTVLTKAQPWIRPNDDARYLRMIRPL